MVEDILQDIERPSRRHLLGTLLRRFRQKADQLSFLTIQASLLYNLRYEFVSSEHHHVEAPEEILSSTAIMEQGLQLSEMSFLPKNITNELNRLSSKRLLSLAKLNETLEQASEEDMVRARARLPRFDALLECCGIIGYLPDPLLRFSQKHRSKTLSQALFLLLLLLLERSGYEENMEIVFTAVQAWLPALRRGQAIHLALHRELPVVAKELATFRQIGQFTPQEREAHMKWLCAVNELHKITLDAFRQRHPEWNER